MAAQLADHDHRWHEYTEAQREKWAAIAKEVGDVRDALTPFAPPPAPEAPLTDRDSPVPMPVPEPVVVVVPAVDPEAEQRRAWMEAEVRTFQRRTRPARTRVVFTSCPRPSPPPTLPRPPHPPPGHPQVGRLRQQLASLETTALRRNTLHSMLNVSAKGVVDFGPEPVDELEAHLRTYIVRTGGRPI